MTPQRQASNTNLVLVVETAKSNLSLRLHCQVSPPCGSLPYQGAKTANTLRHWRVNSTLGHRVCPERKVGTGDHWGFLFVCFSFKLKTAEKRGKISVAVMTDRKEESVFQRAKAFTSQRQHLTAKPEGHQTTPDS